jgi:hypothetical protein
MLFNGAVNGTSAFNTGSTTAQDDRPAADSKDATAETEKERAGPT